MESHNAWIERGFDEGVFLLTGSLQPKLGGGILVHALLALLAGGVSIARAVENSELGDEIADAVRDAADRLMR